MMKIIISIYLFCCLNLSYAQSENIDKINHHNFGIVFFPGASKFNSILKGDSNRSFSDYKSYLSSSFSLGGFYELKTKRGFIFRPEILFSHVRGKESYTFQDSYSDPIVYTYTYWYFTVTPLTKTLTYLHLPISFGYNIKRVKFLLGFQLGYNLSAKVYSESIASYGLPAYFSETFDMNLKSNVMQFDAGGFTAVSFKISKKVFCGARFYYEISNKNSTFNMTWNYSVIGLNIDYILK